MKASRILTILVLAALGGVVAMYVALCVGAHRFWYPYDLAEGLLLDQTVRLAHGEGIYGSLTSPPYYVSNYPPVFMLLQVPFARAFGPSFWYGRVISQVSAAFVALAVGMTVYRAVGDRLASAAAGLLVLCVPPLVFWAQVDRVDLLALAFEAAALWCIATGSIHRTAACVALAGFTRQTSWLPPFIAVSAWLAWARDWRGLRRFVAYVGAYGVTGLLVLEWLTAGGFLRHVLSMRGDPWDTSRLLFGFRRAASELRFVVLVAAGAAVAGLVARQRWGALAAGYLAGALAIGAMFVKVGAYWNYFVEFGVAVALLTAFAMAALRSRPAARNLVIVAVLAQAVWSLHMERSFRPLKTPDLPLVLDAMRKTPGIVVSDGAMSLLPLAGHRIYFEPFTMSLFARTNRWDIGSFHEDLRHHRIALLALRQSAYGYMPLQWNIQTVRVIRREYSDCGHVPIEDGTGDYYVLYRPACLPGDTPSSVKYNGR